MFMRPQKCDNQLESASAGAPYSTPMSTVPSIAVQITETGGALVVTPGFPRLDALAAPGFRMVVLQATAGRTLVVVDLRNVNFVDSSGLGCLVGVLKSMPAGGQLRLTAVAPQVRSLLTLTRLGSVFPIFPSVEEACQP
jgi:anti-sigma B factor antagonist